MDHPAAPPQSITSTMSVEEIQFGEDSIDHLGTSLDGQKEEKAQNAEKNATNNALLPNNHNHSLPAEESFDSVHLNPVSSAEDHESNAVHLLKQIFPEESNEALRRLHRQRVQRKSLLQAAASNNHDLLRQGSQSNSTSTPALASPAVSSRQLFTTLSPAAHAHTPTTHTHHQTHDNSHTTTLPDDFLRLPPTVALRRYDPGQQRIRYVLVDDLHQRVQQAVAQPNVVTRVLQRQSGTGSLGLTLVQDNEDSNCPLAIRVYATATDGPAERAGLTTGDLLVGVNGTTFAARRGLLVRVVELLRNTPDPIVVHYVRRPTMLPALLDTTLPEDSLLWENEDEDQGEYDHTLSAYSYEDEHKSLAPYTNGNFYSTPTPNEASPRSHKIISIFRQAKLLTPDAEMSTQRLWNQFTNRTRQWEAWSCLRHNDDLFVPLMGIRKALSVRIVHAFTKSSTDDRPNPHELAYTIWVYDTETGREFYAPVRTLADFCDLRSAVVSLQSSLRSIDFPRTTSNLFGSPVREAPTRRTRQLEHFLRVLCALLYQGELHESIAEIAIHVQSFLGCDTTDFGTRTVSHGDETELVPDQVWTRRRLKRSLQLYTYRLFLLPPLAKKVAQFVDHVRAREPMTRESMEALDATGPERLKERAMGELSQVKAFLDYLQDLVLDGCMEDFQSIAARDEYRVIHAAWTGNQGEVFWDRLVREAVREQVEIEVYVPLRSMLSKWLVRGWRHEDMEAHFKIKELRKRPQRFFRLPSTIPMDEWMKASAILKEGVGQSTLPCVKLRAIVDAAQEISQIFERERPSNSGEKSSPTRGHLGADLFLPIFIFCVVQAEIDRPSALCALLRNLCDRINKIGEIGYYLASFEAAVCHIQEIDLAEEQGQQMRSFLAVNLDS